MHIFPVNYQNILYFDKTIIEKEIKMLITEYHLVLYRNHENTYQNLVKKDNYHGDSGIDIYMPNEVIIPAHSQVKVRLGLHAAVRKKTKMNFPGSGDYCVMESASFFLLPRSSISKTPLRLSNSIGLIDSGYRGELLVYLDNISDEDYCIKQGDRLFQLVNANLSPFSQIIENETEPEDETERGAGGHGSSGR
jgi:dUTP pyrophosphatase